MEIVLIGGPSAVGKDTLIQRLSTDHVMRNRLGIPDDAQYLTAKAGKQVRARFGEVLQKAHETAWLWSCADGHALLTDCENHDPTEKSCYLSIFQYLLIRGGDFTTREF